nr:hypothetical protein [Tanacetum cinerariifolium]
MEDEHLSTSPEKESDEFIKSSVENLVLNPSESEDLSDIESECDVSVCDDFTTFSNLLFDADDNFSSNDDNFSSNDDQSFSDEDVPKEIYLNPLFDEEIISIKIDPHHLNVESDLIESLLNQDSSIISFSKIDSLHDKFAGELIFLKSIPSGIDEVDCDPEEEIHLIEKLLYDNSSPHPPEEFNSENSNAIIESFSPSPIPIEDIKVLILQINFATRKVPPRKSRKYKKVASPLRKFSLVKEAEPLKKTKRVKSSAKKSTTALTAGVAIRDTHGVSVSKKKAHAKADRSKDEGTGTKPRVLDVPEYQYEVMRNHEVIVKMIMMISNDDDDNENDNDSKGDDDKADSDDDGNFDADDNERTNSDDDDENPFFTLKVYDEEEHDEEYESDDDYENMFEEEDVDLYKDVDVRSLGAKQEQERKGYEEMTDAD